MKTINPAIYKEISNGQRANAAYAAILRGDDKEAARLVETCGQKTYRQADLDFTDALIKRIAESEDLGPEEKAQALISLHDLTRGQEAEVTTINLIKTVVHKRSADWPPEDVPEGHLVSDD